MAIRYNKKTFGISKKLKTYQKSRYLCCLRIFSQNHIPCCWLKNY